MATHPTKSILFTKSYVFVVKLNKRRERRLIKSFLLKKFCLYYKSIKNSVRNTNVVRCKPRCKMPRPKNNVLLNLFLTNGGNEVYCNNDNCQNKTLAKHTGNLERHLKIYHPKLYADYIQKKYASKSISRTLKNTVAVSDEELCLYGMPERKMNTSESSVDRTSDSCSDQELGYFPPSKLCKIKLEKVEEFATQYVDAPTTECVEDTSKSELMDAPSSSTHVGASEDSNDPLLSSSIRLLENSAKSIAKASITEELFGCLAKKVNQANLTAQQINDIENSVCLLVYSKLVNYNKDCNSLANN